jgi:hypothetical protein
MSTTALAIVWRNDRHVYRVHGGEHEGVDCLRIGEAVRLLSDEGAMMRNERLRRLLKALGVHEYILNDCGSRLYVAVPLRVCAVLLMFLRREWPIWVTFSVCSLNLINDELWP